VDLPYKEMTNPSKNSKIFINISKIDGSLINVLEKRAPNTLKRK